MLFDAVSLSQLQYPFLYGQDKNEPIIKKYFHKEREYGGIYRKESKRSSAQIPL